MTVIYGRSEAEERMRRETMTPNSRVAVDHDYYSGNAEAAREKSREIKEEEFDGQDNKQNRLKRATGGAIDREDHSFGSVVGDISSASPIGMLAHLFAKGGHVEDGTETESDRELYALGGVAKLRKGYPNTKW